MELMLINGETNDVRCNHKSCFLYGIGRRVEFEFENKLISLLYHRKSKEFFLIEILASNCF